MNRMKRIYTTIILAILVCSVYASNDTIVVNNKRYVILEEVVQPEMQDLEQTANEQPIQEQATEQKVQKEKSTTPKKKSNFWSVNKITYGGGFGFKLNSSEFYVMIMPEVGYQLFEPWHFSVAPKYAYNGSYNDYFSEHTVGVRIATRVDLIRLKRNTAYRTNIFFALAYQYDYQWGNYYSSSYENNYFDAGIGIRQAIGSRSNLYVLVGWHLYESHNNSWFSDPIPTISVGFEI